MNLWSKVLIFPKRQVGATKSFFAHQCNFSSRKVFLQTFFSRKRIFRQGKSCFAQKGGGRISIRYFLDPKILDPKKFWTQKILGLKNWFPNILGPKILNPLVFDPKIRYPKILDPKIWYQKICIQKILNPKIVDPKIRYAKILDPKMDS